MERAAPGLEVPLAERVRVVDLALAAHGEGMAGLGEHVRAGDRGADQGQDRIIRGRMPTFEMTTEKFARLFRLSLSSLLRRVVEALPQYDYVYLGDNARAPYGSRSQNVVYAFTLEAVENEPRDGASRRGSGSPSGSR